MELIQPVTQRYISLEVNLGATIAQGKTIAFNYTPDVQTGLIYCIRAYSQTDWALSPLGNTVVTTAGLANIVVTLVVGDDEEIQQYPLTDFRPASNSGFLRLLNNKKLNLVKSYITILSTAALAANQSVMFGFDYKNQ